VKLSKILKEIKKITPGDPDIRIGKVNSNVDFEIERTLKVFDGALIVLSPNAEDRVYGKWKKIKEK